MSVTPRESVGSAHTGRGSQASSEASGAEYADFGPTLASEYLERERSHPMLAMGGRHADTDLGMEASVLWAAGAVVIFDGRASSVQKTCGCLFSRCSARALLTVRTDQDH